MRRAPAADRLADGGLHGGEQEQVAGEAGPQQAPSLAREALGRILDGQLHADAGRGDQGVQQQVERAGSPSINVRVVPFAAGAHPAQDSPFVLLAFADDAVSDVAYVEGLRGRRLVDERAELERYQAASARIQILALSESASIALIEKHLPRWTRDDL